ncbi:hypothetical protein VKT23_013063 [Stygiomarasmius scandens]|uniref:Uncharacterized protein n=1 Tax=Marasmiellus scandens TaxID=2682957 RepID=A0ABR1J7R6_9AGAR
MVRGTFAPLSPSSYPMADSSTSDPSDATQGSQLALDDNPSNMGVLSLHDEPSPAGLSTPQPSSAAEPSIPVNGPRRSLRHSSSAATLETEQQLDDLIDSLNPEHDKDTTRSKPAKTKSPKKKPSDKAAASSLNVLDHRITDVEALQKLQEERLTVTARELHERVDEITGTDFRATILQLEELHASVSLMRNAYDARISDLQTASTLTTQTLSALRSTSNDLVHEVRRLVQDTATSSNNRVQLSADVTELKRRLAETGADHSSLWSEVDGLASLQSQVENLSALVSTLQSRSDLSATSAKCCRMDDLNTVPTPNLHEHVPVLSLGGSSSSTIAAMAPQPTFPPAPVAALLQQLPPAPVQTTATIAPASNSAPARQRRWGVSVGPMSFDSVDITQPGALLQVATTVISMTGNDRVNSSAVTATRHGANHLLMTWPWRNQAENFIAAWKAKQPLPYPYNHMSLTKDF